MARYIDADKLINSLNLSIKSWGRDCNSSAPIMMRAYQDAVYRVKDMPAADVVPKSEVEEAVEKLMSATDKVICEAKAEVAREIFEEIENFLIKTVGEFDKALDKAVREDKYGLASLYADEKNLVITLKIAIAELKKKYTEGCTTCAHIVSCEPNPFGTCKEYEERHDE